MYNPLGVITASNRMQIPMNKSRRFGLTLNTRPQAKHLTRENRLRQYRRHVYGESLLQYGQIIL
jgi:hypothetical protein